MVAPGFMKGVLAMSALLTKDRSPISSNMSLEQIAHIRDLPHRALALSYTEALTPESALALALVKSVDVPEAGSWGANAVARMASLRAKPKTSRGRKKRLGPSGSASGIGGCAWLAADRRTACRSRSGTWRQ